MAEHICKMLVSQLCYITRKYKPMEPKKCSIEIGLSIYTMNFRILKSVLLIEEKSLGVSAKSREILSRSQSKSGNLFDALSHLELKQHLTDWYSCDPLQAIWQLRLLRWHERTSTWQYHTKVFQYLRDREIKFVVRETVTY